MRPRALILTSFFSTVMGWALWAPPTLALNPQPLPPGRRAPVVGRVVVKPAIAIFNYLGGNSGGDGRAGKH